MICSRITTAILLLLPMGCWIHFAAANHRRDPAPVVALDQWSCVLADRPARLRYSWGEQTNRVSQIEWRLNVGERVLSRGQAQAKLIECDEIGDHIAWTIRRMPRLKPGVVIAAELAVSLHADGAHSQTHRRPLTLFSPDPFVGRERWLRDLNIALFDPAGDTAHVFEQHGIPFQHCSALAAVDEMEHGILVIGEGLNWKDQRGVASVSRRAACRGVQVLCLAPNDGELPLYSASSHALPIPNQLKLAREDIVKRFDKRLDAREWQGGHSLVSALELRGNEETLVACVADSPAAWPWLEMRFQAPRSSNDSGMLIVCGLGIVRHWEAGPVPRYLLSTILERLHNQQSSHSKVISHATP